MSGAADGRLQRLLGGEPLASLRKRLRRPFERAALDNPVGRIRVGGLTVDEHAALAALTGRPQRPSSTLEFEIELIDTILRRSGVAASLRDALEQLDGPIVHLASERERLAGLWSGVIGGCAHPGLLAMLESVAGAALLKRVARQDTDAAAGLCRRTEAVLRRLPAGGVPRSQLAAELLGDAHALDDGRPTSALVLAVLRRDPSSEREDEDGALVETRRAIWASAGVLVNELARPALFLNLPARQTASFGGPPGEPAYASLRSLLRSPPSWDVAGRVVRICENPNLLAIAADRWGASCAPLACTEGMPAAAQRCLLDQLARAGAALRYHGDFDWPGLRIAGRVMRDHGALPWRLGAADYLEAVRSTSDPGHHLTGLPVDSPWDAALAPAMREQQRAVAEEAVAASLLIDLER